MNASGKVYRGESYAKRMARVRVYLDAVEPSCHRLRASGKKPRFLTLAGDEAAEIGMFRHLGAPDRNCWFVDLRSEACAAARLRAPNAHVYEGDIMAALDSASGLSFTAIHLDYMEPFAEWMESSIKKAWLRLQLGGTLILTVLRARESAKQRIRAESAVSVEHRSAGPGTVRADMMLRRANGRKSASRAIAEFSETMARALNRDSQESAWVQRFGNVFSRVTTLAVTGSGRKLAAVPQLSAYVEYHSGRSPMAVWAFRKTDRASASRGCDISTARAQELNEARDMKRLVRQSALSCHDWPSESLSAIYNVPEGTIRAWRAHESMGTYADESRMF